MLNEIEITRKIKDSLKGKSYKKVLLIPPDYTRMFSGCGHLAAIYYSILSQSSDVDVMPALGTHVAMTEQECNVFFEGVIPFNKLIVHNWKTDVVNIGSVPSEFVAEVSEGLVTDAIPVEVNRRIVSREYDLIISLGQVVPHEVVGMANYSKNIFVGCGGNAMINASHMLGAFYGMERIMGRDFSPVRKVFDYAETHFIKDVPLIYVLTVCTSEGGQTDIHDLFIGRERSLFEKAVKLSQELNFITLDEPIKKCVVYLDPREFKSLWLGNKAIYRTRMAMAEGGELIVLAPGVERFGEDIENDTLIRKYGYCGRQGVLKLVSKNQDLQNNLSVAAHLIHGSSDGRFEITYAVSKLSSDEINNACFNYMPFEEAVKIYDYKSLKDGYNTLSNGEKIYYISNPALGLWRSKDRI